MLTAHATLIEDSVARAMATNDCAWIPGLADALTSHFWNSEGRAFTPVTYGSARWLTTDPGGLKDIAWVLDLASKPIVIETLPADASQRYAELGLQLRGDVPSPKDIALFNEATALLDVQPALQDAIVALVRSVHLLVSAGPGYDTSHSDPDIPCSIFVSVPAGERHGALRLAESILHEAMHLQLTMTEHAVPLVEDPGAEGYSPWQKTTRPIRGLMHGLFVFRVIDQWLDKLAGDRPLDEHQRDYVARRRSEISEEIAVVSDLAASPGLTELGQRFVAWLIHRSSSSSKPGSEE